MVVLPDPIGFQWDKGNIDKPAKHGVPPQQAEEAFFDENKVFFRDWKHSESEERTTLLGKTRKERLLNITYIVRKNKIRIITARPVNKKEVSLYEKAT